VYSFMCHHRYLSSDFHFHCNPFFNSLNLHTVTRLLIIGEVRKVSESAGIITPMRDKSHLQRIVAVAFGSVIVVYLLLFVTSGLAFGT
jgi:hypothetical protein